ncbi:hypothetical protein DKL61_10550 [Gammaproteobacteria bacterium ESL0073]|nr:hypothetical protein DKL61_10550 [Gammaproteobacteria bacterium ESL0073]
MKKILIISLYCFISLPSLADSWRCGNDLVEIGDSKGTVIAKCGPPYNEAQINYSKKYQSNQAIYTTTEELTYKDNGRIYYLLTFEGGKLTHIAFQRCNQNPSPLCD